MAKVTELRNVTVGIQPTGQGGAVLTIEDKHMRETLWINLPAHIAQDLEQALAQIRSGIVVPRVDPVKR